MTNFTVFTHDESEYPCSGNSRYKVLDSGARQLDRDAADSFAPRIVFSPSHWLRVEDRELPRGGGLIA
ncbi:MAG: hypothetical protein QOC82_2755 [Frankiaceae bacterium]|jgi:hypothetical protein|nr:hypothetical protein [Frankiaceae bacterium]